ncbi:MAG TPA: sulfatase-like hydrolase/transferase [Baekduia sp.]|nr:sulfatase-like hydrolase/transferase [Baekduia sp.]
MTDRPNLIILVTDQQRAPQHWPDEPGWLDALMPNDAELRRTGTTFSRAYIPSAMCSPCRASLLTGTYPSRHGVTLTLTRGDLFPDRRHARDALRIAARLAATGEAPRARVARAVGRGILRRGPLGGHEPELPAGIATLGTRLRQLGYHVALKGKWHLTKPVAGDDWSAADATRLERDYGFADWDPSDAGGDAKATSFGGGTAGPSGQGWDEDYTRQIEQWLGRDDLPEPFCLVWCLVNPHDVLGYPGSFAAGGYRAEEFADLRVPLPPTIDEDLRDKPTVQALTKTGQTSYLGALHGREQQQRYVDFYAHLHRLVDRNIGRLLAKLGDPGDPGSLRSRTVIVRTSDHGELGLAHGGLRQKMFNVYEEALRVPFVVSSPSLAAGPRTSDALVSLVDVLPTVLGLAGTAPDGGLDGEDLGPVLRGERDRVRDAVLFTYDDHQAGTAFQEAPGQPNRIRCVRDERWKYAVYADPHGVAAPEYELYDLEADPYEEVNLVDKRTGRGRTAFARAQLPRLEELLRAACERTGTPAPPGRRRP